MKCSTLATVIFLFFVGIASVTQGQENHGTNSLSAGNLAPTPPMGWNSYDAFGSSVTKSQFKAEVDFMKANLLAYGWKYAVIDYLWFNPAGRHNIALDKEGRPLDTLVVDEFGRLLPAVNRFPSAENAKGFRPIADYVHSLGLQFGIHIMRGMPRHAFWHNLPIKGASYRARDAVDARTARSATLQTHVGALIVRRIIQA